MNGRGFPIITDINLQKAIFITEFSILLAGERLRAIEITLNTHLQQLVATHRQQDTVVGLFLVSLKHALTFQ